MNVDIRELQDKSLFNKIAKEYFYKDVYTVSSKARKFQLKSLIDLYLQNGGGDKLGNILELGCGVGASARYLEGQFSSYLGVDYSEEFIQLAKQHFANSDIQFLCANIKDFTIDKQDINFVFGVGVLHHVSGVEQVLSNMAMLGTDKTVYGFVEPQGSNPFVQMLRKIRMIIDRSYSNDQSFYTKEDIRKLFENNGYDLIQIRYQGYFTPPFAQVILKPEGLFSPIASLLINLDAFIQRYLNNVLSWNIIWIARKK